VQAQQRLAWSSLEPKVLGLVNGFQDLRRHSRFATPESPPQKVEIEFRDEIFDTKGSQLSADVLPQFQHGNDVLCAGPVHAARNLWISERVAFNTLVGKSLPLKDHFIHDSW